MSSPSRRHRTSSPPAGKAPRREHKPHRSKHAYALRGVLVCGLCDRKMQGHWANQAPYYRCRFPNEYALANRVRHPLNVTLRQDAVLPPLEEWLASKFGPRYLAATIDELAAAATQDEAPDDDGDRERHAKIADCDRKLASYRAALDAGADPATVAAWITETEAERARYKASRRPEAPRPTITRDDIAAHITKLADVLAVHRDADPDDKPDIYIQLGLRLTYQPGDQIVRADVSPAHHWQFESVRGGCETNGLR